MRDTTRLTGDEFNEVHYFVNNPEYFCPQDRFLKGLCASLRNNANRYKGTGMRDPIIIYGNPFSPNRNSEQKYEYYANYREIIDDNDPRKKIFAYFDCPSSKAPLYLVLPNSHIPIRQLKDALMEKSDGLFKTTPVNKSVVGVMVDMSLVYGNNNERRKHLSEYDKTSVLDFIHENPSKNHLFDMYDRSVDLSDLLLEVEPSVKKK